MDCKSDKMRHLKTSNWVSDQKNPLFHIYLKVQYVDFEGRHFNLETKIFID